jgi:uncharacterized membrane protein YeaQ/YmgE (transglycosylase-associated protein family)
LRHTVAVLGSILSVMLSGFLIGGLARLALPGPDPMPFWFTVFVGLSGSLVGGAIAAGLYGARHAFDTSSHIFVTLLLEIGAAAAILALYRRYVQRRPLSGPEAYRFPTRGVGIDRIRSRLRQVGVDPDKLPVPPHVGGDATTEDKPAEDLSHEARADQLAKLRELHESGVLSDEEYEKARERLRRY